MSYMYHRHRCTTPMERLRTNFLYGFRKNFKPAMKCAAEVAMGFIWLLSLVFFLQILAILLN